MRTSNLMIPVLTIGSNRIEELNSFFSVCLNILLLTFISSNWGIIDVNSIFSGNNKIKEEY